MDKIFELEDELKLMQLEGTNTERCKELLKEFLDELVIDNGYIIIPVGELGDEWKRTNRNYKK